MNTTFPMGSAGGISKDPEMTTPLAERLAVLRQLLSTSTEWVVPWSYYQDEMATRLEFMTQGRWGENAMVESALKGAVKRSGLIGRPRLMLTCHVAKYGFWHGIRVFSSKTGVFFFDETIGHGLLGVKENVSHGPAELFHFTKGASA